MELELPLKARLEAIDARHPDTVALLRGPLVLMAVKQEQNDPAPRVTREEMLAAQRLSEREWQVTASNGPVKLLPFTSLGNLPYTTYVRLG